MAVGHYSWANNGRGQMRAADVDRDRAVGFLKEAYTEGRLDKDEYDVRVESALSARTYADLDLIVSDLPGARASATAYHPVTKTNGLAIASLACGLGQFMLGPLTTIPAIVLGHMARHQIRRTGEDGAAMALAGLLLGWAAVALGLLLLSLALIVFTASAHATGGAVHTVPVPPLPQPQPGP